MRRRAVVEKGNRLMAERWSPYRAMWTLVLFDLPVKTKDDRRNYTRFRRELLKLGFVRMQFSAYYKHSPTDEKMKTLARRIKKFLPPYGEVRLLHVTAKQFSLMEVFHGKKAANPESEPQQLELF